MRLKSNYILIGIILLSTILNFYNLGERALQQDEAIYAAQSAILDGHDEFRQNFLPYSRSATNFQIEQFITSISFRLLGISEFSSRLPTALMGVMSVILIYILAETLFNSRVGLFSAFIMAVNGYTLHFTRQMQLDTGLMFFSLLSIVLLIKWHKTNEGKKKDWYFYIFLASAILAIMVKVAAIFILIPLIVFYLYIEKEFENAIKMLDRPQSVLIIILSLLYIVYFIFYISGYDEFMKTFSYAVGRESKYDYTFYIGIITGYIGYVILIISLIGLIYTLKHGIRKKSKEDIFCAFWFIFGMIFFSIYPLKAYSYILPIVPAMCLLNGRVLDSFVNRFEKSKITMITIFILIIISSYPTFNYSYAKIDKINEIGPEMINRYNPIKDYVLRDTAFWLKDNVDNNDKIAIYSFANHHDIAFYSGLEVYTIKLDPGLYMPINGTAKIVWDDFDPKELIKNGEIDYIIYLSVGEQRFSQILSELDKKENIKFIPYYQRNYTTPQWYSQEGLNVTIFKVQRNKKELRFITVGDPYVSDKNIENRGNERLEKIINFVNNRNDTDFVVFMGDMTNEGTNESNAVVKNILSNLKKPYYVVAGNHDILISEDNFRASYGPMKHIEMVNGYQLLFIGIFSRKDDYGNVTKLGWSFNFTKIDKKMPTLVFIHGAVRDPPSGCSCVWTRDFFKYGQGMQPELDKFTNLVGVYSGHVHYDSDQTFNGTVYITINGLIIKEAGGILAQPSDKIGYTTIEDGNVSYNLISYN